MCSSHFLHICLTLFSRIGRALDEAKIRFARIDGRMNIAKRASAIETLNKDDGCEVILISLTAGGTGLNLTAARRVYLMDPFWLVVLFCALSC